ncbi:MAG: protein-export chaperone SecB, partial [Burkholderiaceae bacterium]
MTDNNTTPESPAQANQAASGEAEAARPVFNLQRVYLKDCSLEAPHAPHIFL